MEQGIKPLTPGQQVSRDSESRSRLAEHRRRLATVVLYVSRRRPNVIQAVDSTCEKSQSQSTGRKSRELSGPWNEHFHVVLRSVISRHIRRTVDEAFATQPQHVPRPGTGSIFSLGLSQSRRTALTSPGFQPRPLYTALFVP